VLQSLPLRRRMTIAVTDIWSQKTVYHSEFPATARVRR